MAMKDFDDDFDELDAELGRKSRAPERAGGHQTLRMALVMLAACVILSLGIGRLMPEFTRTPVRTSTTAAVVVPPAQRRAPSVVPNQLQYTADASGHFFVDAVVNGAPVHFLVDTGATFVSLSPDDAAAAGLSPQTLAFTEATNTANGVAHVARTSLRSIRLGQLEVSDVSAVVMERPMPVSLLGMSFLNRVGGNIRDGVLTIEW
jgi:aspartyl protease family protein